MGQEPDAIWQEIEETRQEASRTTDEIACRADVPRRFRSAVQKQRERWFREEGTARQTQKRLEDYIHLQSVSPAGILTAGFLTFRLQFLTSSTAARC